MTHRFRCPQCGYVEPVAWRGSKWTPDWQVADFFEFKQAYPEWGLELERRLGEANGIVRGDYYYFRPNGRTSYTVVRVYKEIYKANGNRARGKGTYVERTWPVAPPVSTGPREPIPIPAKPASQKPASQQGASNL